MRRLGLIIAFILLCINAQARDDKDTLGRGTAVSFVENQGQWPHPYRYEAQLHNAALFAEEGAVTIALRTPISHPEATPRGKQSQPARYHAYRMTFAGASAVQPEGASRQPGYNNYYIGPSPATWRSRVPQYALIAYYDLYPGIDLEIYGAAKAMKYNFVVHPDGDPSDIAIDYDGTDGVQLATGGNLTIHTSVRDVVELCPYVFQQYGDREVEVSSRWRLARTRDGHYRATIEVGDYDRSRDLIVDPTLIFSTYTGSTADNWGTTATFDQHKNVYTAGLVFGIGYPVSLGAYQGSYGGGNTDVGIFKFDSTGADRLFATYLGGSSADMPHSLIVNSFDELIVLGTTGSYNFPVTAGAFQTTFGGGDPINYLSSNISYSSGSDIFISRFSADGTQLQASTYVGGSGNDGLNYRQYYNSNYQVIMSGNDSLYKNYGDGARGEIITDQLNNVYVGSTTFSYDFPTTANALQPDAAGRQEGVVFKIDHGLHTMLWCTYLGGQGDDAVYSIDVDREYNLLVCGGSSSHDFPVTDSAYQPTFTGGTTDGFVSKISYEGDRLMASSYLGEHYYDQLYFVRTGPRDDVFLFGQTYPTGNAMVKNAGYSVFNSGMLLARMSPLLDTLRWSTVFGTSGRINLSPTAFGVDICDRIYAAGWGRDFVGYNGVGWHQRGTTGMETTDNAWMDSTDGQDFYIISLSSDASTLEFGSFFGEMHGSPGTARGSDHVDGGTSRFDRQSTLYQSVCASCGGDNGFPVTSGAWSSSNNASNCNNAIFRFNVHDSYPVADFTMPAAGCAPYTIQFNNTGRGDSFQWFFGDGATSTDASPTHTYTAPGTYDVTLVATLTGGCKEHDTIHRSLLVLGDVAYNHPTEMACDGTPVQIGVTPSLGATFNWTGGTVSDPSVANPWVTQTGIYILHTTADGCTQHDTFSIRNFTLVDNLLLTGPHCHDSLDAKATFRLGNNINPDSIAIVIDPPADITPVYSSGPRSFFDAVGLVPDADYHITVTGYGCVYENDLHMPNTPPPAYEKETRNTLCSDSCTGSIHLRYNLSLVPEDTPKDTLIEGLCEGTYITHLVSLGCPLTDTTVISRDHSLDNLHASADPTELYLGQTTQLSATGAIGTPTYAWSPAADIDNPASAHPTATPTDTLVCYTVTATSADGCQASDTVCVHCTAIDCGELEQLIPNAFTPNGDGINDRLCFQSQFISEFHIAIFNRWGQCVYESDDINQCWDGTFRNERCLAGVYTYSCRVRCVNDVDQRFKGDITLIR